MNNHKRTDVRQRQQMRQFIGGWMRGRDRLSLAEIQAAALDRFARDATFVQLFWPIAAGVDLDAARAMLKRPLDEFVEDVLREADRTQTSRFTFEGDHWVRRDTGKGSGIIPG